MNIKSILICLAIFLGVAVVAGLEESAVIAGLEDSAVVAGFEDSAAGLEDSAAVDINRESAV